MAQQSTFEAEVERDLYSALMGALRDHGVVFREDEIEERYALPRARASEYFHWAIGPIVCNCIHVTLDSQKLILYIKHETRDFLPDQ